MLYKELQCFEKDIMIKKKILVIDDEEEIRVLYHDLLEFKYEVDTASDGLEGLEMAKNKTYDLIILDIIMPILDGFQTLKEIKGNAIQSKVLLCTNLSMAVIIDEVKKSDADDFMIKSETDPGNLIERVQKIIF